jgi:hypothetical protein
MSGSLQNSTSLAVGGTVVKNAQPLLHTPLPSLQGPTIIIRRPLTCIYTSHVPVSLREVSSTFLAHYNVSKMIAFAVLVLTALSASINAAKCRPNPRCPNENGCTTTASNGAVYALKCFTDYNGPTIAVTHVSLMHTKLRYDLVETQALI